MTKHFILSSLALTVVEMAVYETQKELDFLAAGGKEIFIEEGRLAHAKAQRREAVRKYNEAASLNTLTLSAMQDSLGSASVNT